MSNKSLLIDLGGTSCKLALSNNLDEIIIIDTPRQPQDLIEKIKALAWDYDSIKVAAAGHWEKQILKQSHNLAEYIDYPIWQELVEACPVEVQNDMYSAARGEALIGQKNKYKNLVYLNLGTGIGASYYDGAKIMSQDYSPCLRLDLRPSPKGIFYSKSQTDTIQDSISALQDELINLALMLSPEIITIGGGKAKEHWTSIVEPAIKESLGYLNQNLCYQIKIERAKLEYPALTGLNIQQKDY